MPIYRVGPGNGSGSVVSVLTTVAVVAFLVLTWQLWLGLLAVLLVAVLGLMAWFFFKLRRAAAVQRNGSASGAEVFGRGARAPEGSLRPDNDKDVVDVEEVGK